MNGDKRSVDRRDRVSGHRSRTAVSFDEVVWRGWPSVKITHRGNPSEIRIGYEHEGGDEGKGSGEKKRGRRNDERRKRVESRKRGEEKENDRDKNRVRERGTEDGKGNEFERSSRGKGNREKEDEIMRYRFRDDAEEKGRNANERAAPHVGGGGWRETAGNNADGKENRENGVWSGSFKEAIL